MKNKIKEVENYFRAKIVEGDFLCEIQNKTIAKITIDGEYIFALHFNDIENWPEFTSLINAYDNYMNFELSKDESRKISEVIKPILNDWIKDTRLKELQEELKQLTDEK